MQPIWSPDSLSLDMWAPTTGWSPQFTGKDRLICANLYAHALRKGCSAREAEALALQKTWKLRAELMYLPAAERRLRAVFGV